MVLRISKNFFLVGQVSYDFPIVRFGFFFVAIIIVPKLVER